MNCKDCDFKSCYTHGQDREFESCQFYKPKLEGGGFCIPNGKYQRVTDDKQGDATTVFVCGGGSDIRLDINGKRIEFNGVDISKCVEGYRIDDGAWVSLHLCFKVEKLETRATV